MAMGWTPPHLNGIKVPDWKRHQPVNGEKGPTTKLMRVGVDLAKSVFQVHGVDRKEKAVWRQKLTRANWVKVFVETVEPGCEIGMEACGGAHHWARALQAHGFTVRVKPSKPANGKRLPWIGSSRRCCAGRDNAGISRPAI
jgi:hypothetical protein